MRGMSPCLHACRYPFSSRPVAVEGRSIGADEREGKEKERLGPARADDEGRNRSQPAGDRATLRRYRQPGTAMSAMQSEVCGAFRGRGAAADEALKAAAVLGKRDDDLAAAVASLKLDIAAVKADQVLTKGMIGFLLAFDVAIVFKLLSH